MPSTEHMTGEQVRVAMGGAAQSAKPIGKARACDPKANDELNRTETAYKAYLDLQKLAGQVLDYRVQKITVKIGENCRFTPDFLLLMPDRTLMLVDTKGSKKNKATGKIGFWAEEDAVVKIKAAAEQFPFFRFAIAWKVGDDWQHREIG